MDDGAQLEMQLGCLLRGEVELRGIGVFTKRSDISGSPRAPAGWVLSVYAVEREGIKMRK